MNIAWLLYIHNHAMMFSFNFSISRRYIFCTSNAKRRIHYYVGPFARTLRWKNGWLVVYSRIMWRGILVGCDPCCTWYVTLLYLILIKHGTIKHSIPFSEKLSIINLKLLILIFQAQHWQSLFTWIWM